MGIILIIIATQMYLKIIHNSNRSKTNNSHQQSFNSNKRRNLNKIRMENRKKSNLKRRKLQDGVFLRKKLNLLLLQLKAQMKKNSPLLMMMIPFQMMTMILNFLQGTYLRIVVCLSQLFALLYQ